MSDSDQDLRGRRTPVELEPEEFREIGHRLVDDITELLASMRTRRLAPGESSGQIRSLLKSAAPLPEQGTDAADLMKEAVGLLFDRFRDRVKT